MPEDIRDAVAKNMPYDEMVRAIVTAQGDLTQYGPANLYRAVKTPEELAKALQQLREKMHTTLPGRQRLPVQSGGALAVLGLGGQVGQLVERDQQVVAAAPMRRRRWPAARSSRCRTRWQCCEQCAAWSSRAVTSWS